MNGTLHPQENLLALPENFPEDRRASLRSQSKLARILVTRYYGLDGKPRSSLAELSVRTERDPMRAWYLIRSAIDRTPERVVPLPRERAPERLAKVAGNSRRGAETALASLVCPARADGPVRPISDFASAAVPPDAVSGDIQAAALSELPSVPESPLLSLPPGAVEALVSRTAPKAREAAVAKRRVLPVRPVRVGNYVAGGVIHDCGDCYQVGRNKFLKALFFIADHPVHQSLKYVLPVEFGALREVRWGGALCVQENGISLYPRMYDARRFPGKFVVFENYARLENDVEASAAGAPVIIMRPQRRARS